MERMDEESQPAGVVDGIGSADLRVEDGPRLFGRRWLGRDEEGEVEVRRRQPVDLAVDAGDEAAVDGGGGVVGVALACRGPRQELSAGQAFQPQGGDPGRGAAAQPDAERDVALDAALHAQLGERVTVRGLRAVEGPVGLGRWLRLSLQPEVDRHRQHVEARPQVCDRRWNPDLHRR